MRKELIVIKWVVIFIVHIGYSQNNLSGVYSPLLSLQEHYETFEFKDNGKFEYHSGASLGDDEYAIGSYHIDKDYLFLIYKTEPLNVGYHISKVWDNKSDSIKINFHVLDFYKDNLQGANIIYKDIKSKNKYQGAKTDINGKAQFQFEKKTEPTEFIISFLGFRIHKLFITKNYSYDINVYLKEQKSGIPIRNKIEKYKIIENKNDYLLLENINKEKIKWKKLILPTTKYNHKKG